MIDIRQALETRLAAMTPAIATIWENTGVKPPVGLPYQKVFLLPATPDNPTLGDNFVRDLGIFQVSLYYPANESAKDVSNRAKAVRSWFHRGLSLTSGGVTTTIEKTPEISPAFSAEDRYVVPVRIRYFANQMN